MEQLIMIVRDFCFIFTGIAILYLCVRTLYTYLRAKGLLHPHLALVKAIKVLVEKEGGVTLEFTKIGGSLERHYYLAGGELAGLHISTPIPKTDTNLATFYHELGHLVRYRSKGRLPGSAAASYVKENKVVSDWHKAKYGWVLKEELYANVFAVLKMKECGKATKEVREHLYSCYCSYLRCGCVGEEMADKASKAYKLLMNI